MGIVSSIAFISYFLFWFHQWVFVQVYSSICVHRLCDRMEMLDSVLLLAILYIFIVFTRFIALTLL